MGPDSPTATGSGTPLLVRPPSMAPGSLVLST